MSPRRNYNQMYKEESDTRNKEEMKESKLYETETEAEEKPVVEKKPVKKAKKKEGVVVGGTLNVRNAPGGSIIGSLQSGDVIEILEEQDEWYKIDKGFVMAKFVEVK